ncbi:MAG TPA: transcriptional regulator [Porphyromonadaceae bacterium]|nr:transcriptional regulator [Porphyromonadaceae bacterium]
MLTNDHKTRNYSSVLVSQYGAKGTSERAKFDEEAYSFYTSQILLDARKNARLSQEELARRIGADKSYISRIEKGTVVPSVATFYRIINALGLSVNISPAL